MKNYDSISLICGLGVIALGLAAITYIVTDAKHKEVKKIEAEAALPPEYWEAKATEAKASVEKHRIDTESHERLTIDARNREDLEKANIREFEKNAPAEYWEHKKIAEEEETKRQQTQAKIDSDITLEKARLDAERRIAKSKSDAIRDGARSISNAINGGYSSWTIR